MKLSCRSSSSLEYCTALEVKSAFTAMIQYTVQQQQQYARHLCVGNAGTCQGHSPWTINLCVYLSIYLLGITSNNNLITS
mmetsp:Transcript_27493/g.51595  ORF Transcript_27493/g.51595 Transcript_27493/m.51595 type:complete len:80 (+) Transcript_27493:270-509(+)